MGASATALYGINLLLNPVPPEEYKNQPSSPTGKKAVKAPPVTGSQGINAKKKKMQWWRRKAAKGKKKGKKGGSDDDPEDPDPDKV